MRILTRALAVLSLLAAPLAPAQNATNLCEDHLAVDKQQTFSGTMERDPGEPNATINVVPGRGAPETNATNLQLIPPEPLNPEKIFFPYDQRVTISYVFESAGASHALGYMFLDDAIDADYVDEDSGALLDLNANGIYDLHEDLFNMAPTSGPKMRPYVGKAGTRRCNKPFTSGGMNYTEPELAMKDDCAITLERRLGETGPRAGLADARPGRGSTHIDTDLVGVAKGAGNVVGAGFSDGGLFARIPNLLEPKDPENGGKGIGQMVFLLADDDSDKDAYRALPPIADISDSFNGIPDYNVSNYDNRGILLDPGSRDNVIDIRDRTVDLGPIPGGKEIVFFLIVYYDSNHGPNEGTVYPCLKQDSDGKCLLHIRSPISVFFSKSAWNMDQNSTDNPSVAERNIGCEYVDSCNADDQTSMAADCMLQDNSKKMCGWLDDDTLDRLASEATYGQLVMPKEPVSIPRPVGNRNPMPHVIVGAPSTDPFRWILGFEDLPGGGDRDFNDVVFVINKKNGGTERSASLSGDIDLSDAADFVITKVRFGRYDDAAPYPNYPARCSTPPCWTETTPGACKLPGRQPPTIEYSVAVDCHNVVFENGAWVRKPNLNRQWIPVRFPADSPNSTELDLLDMGFTGSQLCWKVEITSPDDRCVPVVDNVNVGYQAVRAGAYSRSSPSTVGNVMLWGVNETPGSAWGKSWPGIGQPEASTRLYDDRKDYSLRGRLYLASRYDPENPTVANFMERWDAGRVMAMSLRGAANPLDRKLYTQAADDSRATLEDDMTGDDAADSVLFPDSLCNEQVAGKYLYDINNDGRCGTPTIESPAIKHIPEDFNDRNVFREWLYGWEDHQSPGATNVKRPWPMGGINLSTVAVAVPPYLDSWAQNAPIDERDLYRRNFMRTLEQRPTVAYVGTMNGFLHAFESGAFRVDANDTCSPGKLQANGYFKPSGAGCAPPITPRDYGNATEKFAYLPRTLLDRYRYLYVKYQGSAEKPKPQMDASPTIANVDFGGLGAKWTLPSPVQATDRPLKGARTVLVSATGKSSPAVFALDITRPDSAEYPMPLWEFNLNDNNILGAFTDAADDDDDVLLPDNSGSRHNPSVVRIKWGDESAGKWTAIVGTDYKPTSGRSGTIYLLDMTTGKPLRKGNGNPGRYAGVITLDENSGIAGATAAVDTNRDGEYDVLYVPTTAGSVYRINLDSVETSRKLGRQVKTCKIASAPVAAATHRDAANNPAGTEIYQQIHANLAISVVRSGAAPRVRFYFGTSDSPDEFSDGPPNKNDYQYHLMAFEDTDPRGTGACALLDPLWVSPLDAGQAVWGGVALGGDKVFTTTAVGTTADLCNLSEDESGKLYSTSQTPDGNGSVAQTSVALTGHGISAPVVQGSQVIVLPSGGPGRGTPQSRGALIPPGVNANDSRSRMLIYDPIPDGRLPR
ncbi:DUF4114 domain-containing protein [Myxococcus sp. CA056]|uniref:DUF4114 domain-containing protein n=1 Tax=unclassified Myxococcus TaxID=2648731 RepID=UPI00157BA896|nr:MULTISPECIES: DUF4114 domain-containing protein [unclassified Myxococcus]NTX10110.1 DUF4114 domain-containing protein [Myxococcus sp. CA056]NTX39933.1 DUF4114 domain-containing protein [Myxococcus sp. CA033]